MTENEKYDLLLKELALLLDEKNQTISFMKYRISDLEKAVTDAESEITKLRTGKKHLEIR